MDKKDKQPMTKFLCGNNVMNCIALGNRLLRYRRFSSDRVIRLISSLNDFTQPTDQTMKILLIWS